MADVFFNGEEQIIQKINLLSFHIKAKHFLSEKIKKGKDYIRKRKRFKKIYQLKKLE